MLELTIDFRTILALLSWFAAVMAVLSLLLVVRASQLRRRALKREAEFARLRTQWEPVLNGAPQHRAQLPPIPQRHLLDWMRMWNESQDAAYSQENRAARQAWLNDIAARKSMASTALLWLTRRDVVDRLAAITMLGHLREDAAAPMLLPLCGASNPLLSIAAARALLQIDKRFATRFVTMIVERADWAPGKLVAIVREEHEALAQPLRTLCGTGSAPAPVTRALVPYLRYLPPAKAILVVRELLQFAGDAETLSAALKVLAAIGTGADAASAGKLAGHENWHVRVQAANALGALGGGTHVPLLTALLNDSHWWVRYRAAQALASVCDRSGVDLSAILCSREDPFARDMLTQVMASRTPPLEGVAAS